MGYISNLVSEGINIGQISNSDRGQKQHIGA